MLPSAPLTESLQTLYHPVQRSVLLPMETSVPDILAVGILAVGILAVGILAVGMPCYKEEVVLHLEMQSRHCMQLGLVA